MIFRTIDEGCDWQLQTCKVKVGCYQQELVVNGRGGGITEDGSRRERNPGGVEKEMTQLEKVSCSVRRVGCEKDKVRKLSRDRPLGGSAVKKGGGTCGYGKGGFRKGCS